MPVYIFLNKIAPKIPNNIPKNPPFCSFVSFFIILVIPFHKILESSRALVIFKISFISSLEIMKNVVPIADTAAVIPDGDKIFFTNETATFISGPAILLNKGA